MSHDLVELSPTQLRLFESIFNKYSIQSIGGENVVQSNHLYECISATLSDPSIAEVVIRPSDAWLTSVLALMDPDAEGVLPFDDAVLVVRRFLTEQLQGESALPQGDADTGEDEEDVTTAHDASADNIDVDDEYEESKV
jgi:hypothetical protein